MNSWTLKRLQSARPIVFVCIPFAGFLSISIPLLLNNEPDWFSRLGSAIVIWAILNYSILRANYSNSSKHWAQQRAVKHINNIRELDRINQERLDLTFDIHATQISQILHHIGKSEVLVHPDEKSLREFCEGVRNRMADSDVQRRYDESLEKLNSFEHDYRNEHERIGTWPTLIWRLEVLMLIWGTAQWGYGDLLVCWWHQ